MIDKFSQVAENLPAADRDADRQYHVINGYPVVFDATHSVQKPSINGTTTGGDRRYVPYLMNAALSIGVDAIFAEVHPCPEKAWSDAANQLKLSDVRPIITHAIAVDSLTKNL